MESGRIGLRCVIACSFQGDVGRLRECFIKLVGSQPLWAKLYYLVRTGHAQEALAEAFKYQQAIEHREDSFVSHFKTWVESPDRR